MDILNTIKSFLKKYKLLNKDTHLLIGFSGGADSMLLLYCLNELKKKYEFSISALHINHGWRGDESDFEENNCEIFCKNLSINFYSTKLSKEIKQDENSARIARYTLFDEYAKKLSANAILTAHNSSDIVETFIYRLIKGMGTTGAMAIPEVRESAFCKIYRPLLSVSSKDIRKECRQLNLKYNIDSSNKNNKYKRNFIRNSIFPKFEEINPSFENAILSYIENIKSQNKILKNYYENNYENIITNNKIITQNFISFNEDIKRIIIYKYLKNNNFEPEKKVILRMIQQIEKNKDKPNGKKYSLKTISNAIENCTFSFFCSQKECYFIENKKKMINFIKFEEKFLPPIKIKNLKESKTYKSTETKTVINKKALNFPLELRTRKAGDIIQPFSHTSEIKLKDYFINKKIPEHMRDEIPLLCKDKEVLWAIGVGISEKLRANLNCKEECIVLEYCEKG